MSDSGFNLLDSLKRAQSTKDALMQAALMALSSAEQVIIFEGDTDYQVYDEWLKLIPQYQNAEHICAKGKAQVISLYKHTMEINHGDLINGCKMFVDHDYDIECYNDNCITTLDCYSVENYLVNDLAITNVLKDEFQLDARRIIERNEILSQFNKDLERFNKLAKDVCLPLYVKHNLEGKAEFYKKISSIISIEYGDVKFREAVEIDTPIIGETEIELTLKERFNSLPYSRTIRGKYHYEFLKKWLVSLRMAINNQNLLNLPRVSKDPEQMNMRRFASATPPPNELVNSSCFR